MSDKKEEKTVDEHIKRYIELRSIREELAKDYDTKDSVLKEEVDSIKRKLLNTCEELGVDKLGTDSGSIDRRVKTRYWISDYESFINEIKKYDAPELFEKRIHQGNMDKFLEEIDKDVLDGMAIQTEYTLYIRRKK